MNTDFIVHQKNLIGNIYFTEYFDITSEPKEY